MARFMTFWKPGSSLGSSNKRPPPATVLRLLADARALQQQQLAQALSGILGNPVGAMPGGAPTSLEPLLSVQLLKTLQQQTLGTCSGGGGEGSAPVTPTGIAGLSPNSAAAGGGGGAGQLHDSSHLLLQLQLMQHQQQQGQAAAALSALHTQLSEASQQSGSSPSGSPRILAPSGGGLGDVLTPTSSDAARQGSPPMMASEEASQIARLIQQQQHQQAAAVAAAAAGSLDPALLAALQNLGLGDVDAAGLALGLNRRSIDNGALSHQQYGPAGGAGDNFLAAAAAALASGNAVGSLGAPGSGGGSMGAQHSSLSGSLPNQSFMSAAAAALHQGAALARSGGSGGSGGSSHAPSAPAPAPGTTIEDDRSMSFDQ
jgi:hypothetical protein